MIIQPDWLVASSEEVSANTAVRVLDGVITHVAPPGELVALFPEDETVDGSGCALLPGFVNSHVHLYGTLAHGMVIESPPTGFESFLDDYWWPQVEDRLDQQMIGAATEWVCAEMLRSGTTTFFDICEAPGALSGVLEVEAEYASRAGMRGIFSFEATERSGQEIAERSLSENLAFIDDHQSDPLVSGAMSWHTVFTCSPQFIERAADEARVRSTWYHAHCNEGTHEGNWARENHGMDTMAFYRELGVADQSFLASQCVQMTDSELDIIAETGTRVSHMPLSNCEVGGGIAPIAELLAKGVTVGLGTDGYVNDMYEVMRGAFWLQKARLLDPSTLPAHDVIHMATEGGAQALGINNLGRIEPGWIADLQLVNSDLPTPIDASTICDQLVLWRSGQHVRDVMVAGEWRVRNGEVLGVDVDRARGRVVEEASRLWGH